MNARELYERLVAHTRSLIAEERDELAMLRWPSPRPWAGLTRIERAAFMRLSMDLRVELRQPLPAGAGESKLRADAQVKPARHWPPSVFEQARRFEMDGWAAQDGLKVAVEPPCPPDVIVAVPPAKPDGGTCTAPGGCDGCPDSWYCEGLRAGEGLLASEHALAVRRRFRVIQGGGDAA